MTLPTLYKHADFEVPDWGEFTAPPINTPGYRSAVLSHDPLAYWRLGETSGRIAVDDSAHGHDAAYEANCLLNQTGALGFDDNPAVYFDGVAARVQLPPSFTLEVDDPITLTFWNRVLSSEVQSAYTIWLGTQNNPDRCLAHAPWSDRVLYWDYGTNNSQGRIETDYSAYLNRWTHISLVSAGRLGNFKAIYLDGQLANSRSTSDGPTRRLTAGTLSINPNTLANRQHRGRLDEVAVFNRVLSAEAIKNLYHAGVDLWA